MTTAGISTAIQPSPFKVLWREFLFRTVDVELLSSQGDPGKLLRQIGMLLMLFSFWVATDAYHYALPRVPHAVQLVKAWPEEHFLIATTMLVTGILAVLSWDSTFPDRRDVLVLGPLPVRARTVFLAKIAALATALGASIGVLHIFTGVFWPCIALTPPGHRPFDTLFTAQFYRSLAAYWITMLSAGIFVYCSVLSVQGLAALLPRRHFLRLSAVLQIGAFCLFVTTYFLDPQFGTPAALMSPANQRALAWMPSWWFLGLLQELNGSMHPAFAPLVPRAIAGTLIALLGAAATFLWSGLRSFRSIVEEPEIVPGYSGAAWLKVFGSSMQTAIFLFTVRTLLRSRKHRVILTFYLAVGFSFVLPTLRTLQAWKQANVPLMAASAVMMCFAIVGVRVVFAMPLNLQANWIFRMTALRTVPEYLTATRRSLLLVAALPVWLLSAVTFLSIWPWRQAVAHLIVLGLLAVFVADISLYGFQKIPFTCSYMPGQANVYWAFLIGFALMAVLLKGVQFELRVLNNGREYARMIAILGAAALMAAALRTLQARSAEPSLMFEEMLPEYYVMLGIFRDGARMTDAATER